MLCFVADQLLDRKPRAIPPEHQRHFEGWNFRTEIQKPQSVASGPVSSSSSNNPNATGAQLQPVQTQRISSL